MSDSDGPITLQKLLEPNESVIAKLPLEKGAFEWLCLAFAIFIASIGILIIGHGVFDTSPVVGLILDLPSSLEMAAFLIFVPICFIGMSNSKIVLTDKKIVKENFLWAEVEAKSWSEIGKIRAQENLLTIEFQKTGKLLVLKTSEAARLKKELSSLLIETKHSEQIEKKPEITPTTLQISSTEPEQNA